MVAQLLIRSDANPHMGHGHVMRCLALAGYWQARGGRAIFLSHQLPDGLRQRCKGHALMEVPRSITPGSADDLQHLIAQAKSPQVQAVVLDGYQFNTDFQNGLAQSFASRKNAPCFMIIDDHAPHSHYAADLVLNQNICADAKMYASTGPNTQLLLGCKYALLRGEFKPHQAELAAVPENATRLLITLGGADPHNTTTRIVNALQLLSLPSLQAICLVGSSNANLGTIQKEIASLPFQATIKVDETDMPSLLRWADLAITASGTTVWELCFLGIPALLVELAENQTPIATELEARGIALRLGWHSELDRQHIAETTRKAIENQGIRQKMSTLGQKLVDGRGAERAIHALQKLPIL